MIGIYNKAGAGKTKKGLKNPWPNRKTTKI